MKAIGTVGNYHIGIYTRLLLMFLVDPLARPQEYWMERWIDMTSFLKSKAPTGAFDFFTYSELIYWFSLLHSHQSFPMEMGSFRVLWRRQCIAEGYCSWRGQDSRRLRHEETTSGMRLT